MKVIYIYNKYGTAKNAITFVTFQIAYGRGSNMHFIVYMYTVQYVAVRLKFSSLTSGTEFWLSYLIDNAAVVIA